MRTTSFASRVALLLSFALIAACLMVAALHYLKFQRLLLDRQERIVAVIATDLAETIEQGLGLGVPLAAVPGLAGLLERQRAMDPALRFLAVAGPRGEILAATDRIAAEAALRAAAPLLRQPIRTGFGDQEGTLLVAHDASALDQRLLAVLLALLRGTLLTLAVALPLLWAGVFLLSRPVRRWFAAMERVLDGVPPRPGDAAAGAVAAALAAAQAALAEAEAELDSLSGGALALRDRVAERAA
mgnify:CR=1 FL=1